MYNQQDIFRDEYLDAPYSFHPSWGPAPSFYPPNNHHPTSYLRSTFTATTPNNLFSDIPHNPVSQKLKVPLATPIVSDNIFPHNQVQSLPTHSPYIDQPPATSFTPHHPSHMLNTPAATPNTLYPGTPENQFYNMVYGSPTAAMVTNQNSRDNHAQQAQYQITHQPLRCLWNTGGQQCQKIFANSEDLGFHVRIEHADGRQICQWDTCIKEFKQKYKLVSHLPVHTGEKAFRCDICAKTFGRAENLKIHKRTHTGEKPFACTHSGCEKKFGNSSDRKKHMHSHSEIRYFCEHPDCGKTYSDPSTLRKHKQTHHKDEASKLLPNPIENTGSVFSSCEALQMNTTRAVMGNMAPVKSFNELQNNPFSEGYRTDYHLACNYHQLNF